MGVQAGSAFNPNDDGELEFDTDRDGSYGDSIAAFGNSFESAFDGGFTYGLHAGFDYEIGTSGFVFGILTDINKTDISESQSGFSSTPAFYTVERDLEFLATLRGRVGYAPVRRLLIYATGGLTYSDVDYSYQTNTPAAVKRRGGQESDYGYTVGGGLEARVTDHISLTVEYLYTNLGGNNFVGNLSGPAAFSTTSASTDSRGSDDDFDFHQIQGKISYRF